MRSRTSWSVGVLARRVSSLARYCCNDFPSAPARRCRFAWTSSGRSLTNTFGMLAFCYHGEPRCNLRDPPRLPCMRASSQAFHRSQPLPSTERTLLPTYTIPTCTCRPPTTTALPGGSQVGAPLRGGLATRALAGGAGVPSAGARFPPRPCCVSSAEPIGSTQRHGLLTLRAGWCTLPTDCSTDLE